MSDAIGAMGTLLKVGDGADPENFTPIAEITALKPPGMENEAVEVTNQGSGGWDEWIPVLTKGGEVSFEINYVPGEATHDGSNGVISLLRSRTTRNWQIVFPDTASTSVTFAAFVQKFDPEANPKDKLKASVTLKVTGPVTWG